MVWPCIMFFGKIPTLLDKLIFRGSVDTEKKWDKLQLVDTASSITASAANF